MNDLKFEAAGVLGMGMMSALFATTRVRKGGAEHYLRFREEGRPVVFVFWHGQVLPLVHVHRHEGIVVLISEHTDGEYLVRVAERHGYAAVRGSSTRGATQGLKGLVRAARAGRDLALTPDGPRGPAGDFKPGALAVAQFTGLPVVPLALGSSRGWRFRSWDGFLVPQPFSTMHVEYGAPHFVPRDASKEHLDELALAMGRELDRLTAVAQAEAER